jgi:DNA-directed RNA polymerase specialized sigma24 family protein
MGPLNEDPRTITAAGLARLLARLHADTEQAGLEYERLRRALVKFFDWRGAQAPDECADETIDRLARKLDGTVVDDVRSYAHGIARLVLLERRRQPVFDSFDGSSAVASAPVTPASDEHDRLHDCFELCLAGIPEDGRSLVLRYYEGERQMKIANRRQLGEALGLSENALRSRVQRLRDRLEQCVQACVGRER